MELIRASDSLPLASQSAVNVRVKEGGRERTSENDKLNEVQNKKSTIYRWRENNFGRNLVKKQRKGVKKNTEEEESRRGLMERRGELTAVLKEK